MIRRQSSNNYLKKIKQCPVVTPTMEQFSDFNRFIHTLEQRYGKKYGMVKIIPPIQWQQMAKSKSLEQIKKLSINNPIQQNTFEVANGVYSCQHIAKKSTPFENYAKNHNTNCILNKQSSQEIEAKFWGTVKYYPPLYGSDLECSLMNETFGAWNFNNLDNPLLHAALGTKITGVTSPYCYVGCWKSFFCWHKQDLDLSAINYLHAGQVKFWYGLPPSEGPFLQQQIRKHFPNEFDQCKEFMRHKTVLYHPSQLLKQYQKINPSQELRITKTAQKPGQFIISFSGSYHCGFNFGFNVAQAINFTTNSWLEKIANINYCKCVDYSVFVSPLTILDNLHSTPFSQMEEYKNLYRDLTMKVEEETAKENERWFKKQLKAQRPKKPKKKVSKKISKIPKKTRASTRKVSQ